MVALFSTRLRRWLLVTVALPLVRAVTLGLARRLERNRGPSVISRGLRRIANPVRPEPRQIAGQPYRTAK